jgi:hypothetical protein
MLPQAGVATKARSKFSTMSSRKPRQPSITAVLLGRGGQHRPDPDVLKARLQERDQREAADDRTPAARWLGDPAPERSALAHYGSAKPR